MKWWKPRAKKIIVVHRIEGLDELCKAINALADARVLAAETLRGHHDPTPPEPAPPKGQPAADERFEKWLAGQDIEPAARDELFVMREWVLGRRPASSENVTRAHAVLAAAGAPRDTLP